MSQPPDDPFHNSPTENNFPPQWQNRAAPRYPQQPPVPQSQQQGFTPPPPGYAQQGQGPNSSGAQYPPQGNFGPPQRPNASGGQPNQGFGPPPQGPNSYPGQPNQGFGPQPQGPNSYPGQPNQGFGPPPQGPNSYPGQPNQGFGPPPQGPNSYPGQPNQGFGPPQGPNSYPGQPNQGFGPPPQGPNSYSGQPNQGFGPPPQGPNGYPGQPNQGFGPPPQGPNSFPANAEATFAQADNQGMSSSPQFAGSEPPGPPAKAKKSNKGWIAIVVILILILLFGGAGFAYLNMKHGGSQGSTTGSKTPTGNGVTQTATQRTGGGTGTVGQPLQAGSNWVATVTRVDTSSSSLFAPSAGNTFLEISMTLKNVSATSQLVTSLVEFSLTDAGGTKHTEAVDDSNIHQPLDASVAAGKTLSGQIAFEVPVSQHTFLLTFSYGLSSGNGSAVSWELTA